MKIMKKSLLALALISTASVVLPYHGDGGAWVGGTAIGLGTGLLIGSSMNRSSENPDTASIKAINKEIVREDKEIAKLRRDLKKGRLSQEEHDERVAEHKENISSLQKQRVQIRA